MNRTRYLQAMLLILPSFAAAASGAATMPAEFVADRVFVDAQLMDGKHLRLYTDTGGGGANLLTSATARRLGLRQRAPTDPEMLDELGPTARLTTFPAFAKHSPLPAPASQTLVVPRTTPQGWPVEEDGMLGNNWFGGHVWTWDYPRKQLLLQPTGWQPGADETVVPLGFKTAADRQRVTNFPRIAITVDGRTLPVLLDTGAGTQLTPAALAAIGDGGPPARATSMIVSTIFQSWHQQHPDWRYLPEGQMSFKANMIEVPEVQIAGYAVGPVWFTERPDKNFHGMMSSGMDSQVEGAVGGNVFRAFEMTVDYPAARAAFRCVRGCRKVADRPAAP